MRSAVNRPSVVSMSHHPLPDQVKTWIDDGHEFATIATIEPDGRPQLSVVWVGYDGDDLLVSTLVGRRKHKNLMNDPRATVLIFPRDSPYNYVEVRGTVTMTTQGGRELIDHFSEVYTGSRPYTRDVVGDERVVVRVHTDKLVLHG